MMKKFAGNGYYYIGSFGHFNINRSCQKFEKKKCLNNGLCISDKEHLKQLFAEALKKDLIKHNVKSFFCVTHDSFIDIIEHIGFVVEVKIKFPMVGKANISELFKQWQCKECSSCKHKEMCFVCNGKLPEIGRDEYFVIFKKKENK